MTAETPGEHMIPASLANIERALGDDHPYPGAARTRGLLVQVLRLEDIDRGNTLKRLHDAAADAAGRAEGDAGAQLAAALDDLLRRANYRELSRAEIEDALRSEALTSMRTHVELSDFKELRIHARGRSRRSEVLRSFGGLRRRRVDFDVLERVFVYSLTRRNPAPGLKLFRAIPVPDLEMLLPNVLVRMRRIDQAAVVVPAAVSVTMMASKLVLSFTALIGTIMFSIGLSEEEPAMSEGWGVVAATSFALLGIASGAWTSYQRRRFQYASQHAQTLYFQSLASESAAFLRVLDEAFEEESKEAVLAWSFLAAEGPRTEAALDARIEAWLLERLGIRCDFEVDDALAKLERLGVAVRDGDRWSAVEPRVAERLLRDRWTRAVEG